ncbi:hypothetical protein [Sediminimonas qiaohouensis]|uniref:hypothetical protein n=1 Tax=Sediminimonas qiaohouensis TaxID=552061 RepID=UPI0004013F2C|nr:hypothetical protein [Sediminimonas qiaohouensis]
MIDLGDRHFEVIHKPGHFIVCIASWETVTGTLFSGNIANDGSLTENTYHSNAQDYCRSMVELCPKVGDGVIRRRLEVA